MFLSLKAKIIFFIVLILVATAAGIIYFTDKDVGSAMLQAKEASARNVLRLVELNISGGYQELVFDKIDAMLQHKRNLKHQASMAASVLESYAVLASHGTIARKTAEVMGLNWIRSLSAIDRGNDMFLFNSSGIIVAHPVPEVETVDIGKLYDLKGIRISAAMTAQKLERGGEFAVFDWKMPGELKARRKLGYFVPARGWDWIAAAVVDISDLEAAVLKKKQKMLSVLEATFGNILIARTGSVFLFNGKKEIIIPPRGEHARDVGGLRNRITGNLLLDDLKQAAGSDAETAVSFVISEDGGNGVMQAYARHFLPYDWYIVVAVPLREIQLPAKQLVTRQSIVIALIFLVSLVVAYFLVTRTSRPLIMLADYARKLPETDFTSEKQLPEPIDDLAVKFKDEVGRLAESFVFMRTELRKNVRSLMDTTAAKERIESELKIAHDIQMGILPKIFPPFPDRKEFDIYAMLEPAKEIGGDLYDFFFIDDDHLCFTIGDVSGKGVPAALFMAITRTLVKMHATRGFKVDEILNRVNRDLSMDNPSLMFVTLFLGILNVRTGELAYSNGGHDPPFIIRCNGDVDQLALTDGLMLGVEEGFVYRAGNLKLQTGEILFLYTDGVTEAKNVNEELFSEERLEKALSELKDSEIKEIIIGIVKKIESFSKDMPQFDDITMIGLKFGGKDATCNSE